MDEPHVDMSVRRDMSVELFHPSFSDPSRQVGVMNTAWILMCTVLGGSILSLPYAIHCCGLVPGMLLLLLTGAAADSSIYTLTSCSRRSGKETFTEIMEVAFGHQVKLIACIMFVMVTFVPLVAYTILLRDLSWPLILKSPGERMLSPNLLMILLVMVIAPACIVKGISSVQMISVFCVASYLFVASVLCIRTAQCVFNPAKGFWSSMPYNINLWPTNNGEGILHGLPIFFCAYVAHFNVLPLHAELKHPTRQRLHQVVHWTTGLCSMLYLLVGAMGYMYEACAGVSFENDNIFEAFSQSDILVNFGRGVFIVANLLSFPLLTVPCRRHLWILWQYASHCRQRTISEKICTEDMTSKAILLTEPFLDDTEKEDEFSQDEDEKDMPSSALICISLGILLCSTLLAMAIDRVSSLWSILGSSVNAVVAFILPLWAYLRIRTYTRPSPPLLRPLSIKVALVVSCITAFACTIDSIWRWFA
eukprot:481750_1